MGENVYQYAHHDEGNKHYHPYDGGGAGMVGGDGRFACIARAERRFAGRVVERRAGHVR